MNTNASPPPPADIDDIMSSIRDSVATEGAKVGQGNDDLLNAAAATEAEGADDDVLELTPAELTASASPAVAANPADVLGVPTLSATDEAADEFDKLLAEIGQEKQQRAAEVEAQKAALLADIEPLGAEPAPAPEMAPETTPEITPEVPAEAAAMSPEASATAFAPMPAGGAMHTVSALESANGMQLVLPAEVLAMALRPMVQGWLDANLPKVVEQLVQAEIAKLNQ